MICKKDFLKVFDGHVSSYSNFLVLNTTVKAVIKELNCIDSEMCVGNGLEFDGHVSFQICDAVPELIYELTKRLGTIGYADTAWDANYLICAKNGVDFNEFTAEWEPDMFYYREDDDLWDAFVLITDNATGAVFHTGTGAIEEDEMKYYKDIVTSHPAVKKEVYQQGVEL